MVGEIITELGEATTVKKDDFLTKHNIIPYKKYMDPRDLNVELAEVAFKRPEFCNIFDKWPSWIFGDILEVIRILADEGFTHWEIREVLDSYGLHSWSTSPEIYKENLVKEAVNRAKKTAIVNEYGVPLEFDGLYQLVKDKNGNITRIEYFYSDIAEKIKKDLGVRSHNEQVYASNNGIYRESIELVRKEITRTVNGIQIAKKGSGTSIKTADQEIMYNIKYSDPYLEWPFNQYNNLVPVNNGIVKIDFNSGNISLIPYSQEYRFTYKLPVNYDPNASSKPMNDILQQYVDNPEVLKQIPAQALLQMLDYGPYKKCYLLHGRPDAGKSSYLESIYRTFGFDNKSDIPLHELTPDRSRFKLAGLRDKLFNIHDDLSSIPVKDAGVIKTLTGAYSHDVEIKNVQPFRADIRAVHVYSCNVPPKYDTEIKEDVAFWNRWEIVHFSNEFENDPDFYNRVFTSENLSGFLNEILIMAIKIVSQGKLPCFSYSRDVQDAWTKCTDPIYTFISTNMKKSKAGQVMYFEKGDFVNLLNDWGRTKNIGWDTIPLNVAEVSHRIRICSDVKITKAPANNDGYRPPAYMFPYEWRENSEWKGKIQPIAVKEGI